MGDKATKFLGFIAILDSFIVKLLKVEHLDVLSAEDSIVVIKRPQEERRSFFNLKRFLTLILNWYGWHISSNETDS